MSEKSTFGRPPKGVEAQSARIYLRAQPGEKDNYERAAKRAGVSVADWIKDRLNRAAKRELSD